VSWLGPAELPAGGLEVLEGKRRWDGEDGRVDPAKELLPKRRREHAPVEQAASLWPPPGVEAGASRPFQDVEAGACGERGCSREEGTLASGTRADVEAELLRSGRVVGVGLHHMRLINEGLHNAGKDMQILHSQSCLTFLCFLHKLSRGGWSDYWQCWACGAECCASAPRQCQ
jgi:hypothetical protein